MEVHTGDPRHLMTQVVAGELDTALVAEPVSDPRLEAFAAFEEELIIVAWAGHPAIAAPKDGQSERCSHFIMDVHIASVSRTGSSAVA